MLIRSALLVAALVISACASATQPGALNEPTDAKADTGCPCSSSKVCTGPRGGRYCITSSGNKRYIK